MKARTAGLLGLGTATAAAATYATIAYSQQRSWGATEEEQRRAMPGDGVVPDADYTSTRAVTVRAAPQDIWPWLAQMGYRRGGLYSYDWLDILFGILDRPSAQRILPEYQGLKAGDVIPVGKGGNFYVHEALTNSHLVIGPEDRSIPISWATALYPDGNGATRLVTRVRARRSGVPGGAIAWWWMDLAGFIMVRRWLLNLKERGERLYRARNRDARGAPAESRGNHG